MMTLKRLMEYRSNGLESTFLMILRTVSDRKEYLVKTLYEDIGWGGSEYESIFFPKNEVYTKDLAGYFEDGVKLAFFTPGSEKVYDGKEKVYSFTMSYEVAYRYLRLGCEALIEQHPEDKEEIEDACKIFRERHNIPEKDSKFNYYDILGNMREYLVWYW